MRINKKYIGLEETNYILNYIRDRYNVIFRPKTEDELFGRNAFIYQTVTELFISYRGDKIPCQYVFNLSSDEITKNKTITGLAAYQMLRQKAKIEKLTEEQIKEFDIEGLTCAGDIYTNPKFNNKRVNAYSYDMNSAFANAMKMPMPIMSECRRYDYPRAGEIGFYLDGYYLRLMDIKRPCLCDWVFKAEVNTGFVKFVDTYYKKKKNAKDAIEKAKYKAILNYSVGYLQLVNPFLRAAIIGYSNNIMANLIDENTVYSNTDSIVSLVPRNDLNIGTELGQFKIEHEEATPFALRGNTYQWGLEKPVYRGIPKIYFDKFKEIKGRDFDLMIDSTPGQLN